MSTKNEFSINADDVEQISTILDGSIFDTMELTTPRFTLRIARSSSGEGLTQEWRHTNAIEEAEVAEEVEIAEKSSVKAATEEGLLEVLTPLPGTFYRSPKPGAAAYIEIGSQVDGETAIAIVETMKLMNSVHAGVVGEVVEICAEDGDMLEKGAVLIRVRPAAED